MGNGHTGQTNSPTIQDFFTVGVGSNSANANNFEAENNLDLTSGAWVGPSSDRNLRNIGNSAINSQEAPSPQGEAPSSMEFGQIIDLAMPPNLAQQDTKSIKTAKPADIVEASLNTHVIKTKDRLDPAGVKEIDNAIIKLNQTGNVADFYDTARNAMEVNLDNSYNRKLAA